MKPSLLVDFSHHCSHMGAEEGTSSSMLVFENTSKAKSEQVIHDLDWDDDTLGEFLDTSEAPAHPKFPAGRVIEENGAGLIFCSLGIVAVLSITAFVIVPALFF